MPQLLDAVAAEHTVLLEAPPGAGKTTVVPPALLDAPWLGTQKILMLEPRRLAAKAAAQRMAQLRGEKVGETIGYRMRHETAVGPRTRIEVMTEGVLARRLVRQPELPGVGLVIFDEFHERSIHADLGLALTMLSRSLVRADLRILVMSATLDVDALHRVVPDAPVVRNHGRSFPVDVRYLRSDPERPLPDLVAAGVRDALRDDEGDVLCFLPGQAEIRRTRDLLEASTSVRESAEVLVLHGELKGEEQDHIIRPSGQTRRVILSTAIAETSITIAGVRVVIDGGRSREPRYDARSGMAHLSTVSVSKDAAEQRKGRAGRTAPGVCYRLWTSAEQDRLPDHRTPEILVTDLATLVLDVAAFGVRVDDCPWIDPPPAGTVSAAIELLRELGALDVHGAITPHGQSLLSYGTHPRIAHMLVRSAELGIDRTTAATVASVLGERDVVRGVRSSDIRRRCDAVAGVRDNDADAGAVRAARLRRDQILHSTAPGAVHADAIGPLVALAYPDRVARRKADGRYLLRNGRTARMDGADPLAREEWLAVADLDGSSSEVRIAIAAPVSQEVLLRTFADQITQRTEAGWSERDKRIVARSARMLGAIVIDQKDDPNPDVQELASAFARVVAERELRDLSWTEGALQFVHRVRFAHRMDPDVVPAFTDDDLASSAEEWLAPYLVGKKTLGDLARVDVAAALTEMMPVAVRRRVDTLAPPLYRPPKGREVPIDYSVPERPTVSVRLQFMFGVKRQPTVASGNVPLTIELLSPAGRPIQTTRDLAGFWSGSYAAVRKEMKGRYPKHDWPENP